MVSFRSRTSLLGLIPSFLDALIRSLCLAVTKDEEGDPGEDYLEGQTEDEQEEEVMDDMAQDPEDDDMDSKDNDHGVQSKPNDLERAQGAEAAEPRDDADMGNTAGRQADPADTESKERAAALSARNIC